MSILTERGKFWWAGKEIPEGQSLPASGVVSGELSIDDEGRASLELDSSLFAREELPKILTHRAGIRYDEHERGICGILDKKRKHIFLFGLQGGMFNGMGSHVYARECFIGRKPFVYDNGDFRFDSILVDMKGYENWLCMGAIATKEKDGKYTIEYKDPDIVSYELSDSTLSFEYGCEGMYPIVSDEIKLKQTAHLNITLKKPLPTNEMQRKYRNMEDLFILLSDSEMRMKWPEFRLAKNQEFYEYYFGRSNNPAAAPDWGDCWVNFPMLRENFGQIFSDWEKKHSNFGPGFYLYLATRRGMPAYVETRFLDLMMGLEGFHRRKYRGKKDEEAIAMREEVLKKMEDQPEKEWLEKKLKYAEEISARERLTEILGSISAKFSHRKLKAFVEKCVSLRNDIIHSNDRDEESWDFLAKVDQCSSALTHLYHLLLLSELGIDHEHLDKLIERRSKISIPLEAVGLVGEKTVPSPITNVA